MNKELVYYSCYKPFGVLSQFSGDKEETLQLLGITERDVYPIGRLDKDSEGLLLLSNDKSVNDLLLSPRHQHSRCYWVQVEGAANQAAIDSLTTGVSFRAKGKEQLGKAVSANIIEAPYLPKRNPPVRFRKSIPTSWINLSLTEGKNRQVRRMTAAAGFPTLRLVRNRIENLELGKLQPGQIRKWTAKEFYALLKLPH